MNTEAQLSSYEYTEAQRRIIDAKEKITAAHALIDFLQNGTPIPLSCKSAL